MAIQASQKQLNQIFNLTNYQFEIPSYQRPYAWTKDQASELIDDLLDAFPYTDEDSPDYFFGSIILIKEDGKPYAEVIDGQQRLTTLTLLLSVFRYLVPRENKIYQKISACLEDEDFNEKNLSGLKLRPQDDRFFGEKIRSGGGINQLLEKEEIDTGLTTDSQILLQNNARFFKEELIDRCPENTALESWILHLFKNIFNKCYLVVVSTSDFDTAYRIFSTINTRGLNLQLNDILKSEIIGNIQVEADKKKYTDIWEGEESDIGRKDFETLFSHIHRIKLRERPKENLLTEFRHKIKPQNDPIRFIDRVLKPCSKMFEIIRDQRFHCNNNQNKQEINRLFGWLNQIDNSDWLPPAIYFLAKSYNHSQQIKTFFQQLERLAAGLMILRADINERGKRYAQILNAIDQGIEEAIAKTKQLLSTPEKKKIIKILDSNLYEQTRSRLYVLKRLDSALAEGGLSPSFDSKMVTIEHVLPQNPKPNSDWCKNWDDKTRAKWVHRVGNLALLSRKKNSSAQNYDFEKKKTKYFKDTNPTIFPITIKIINENEWNLPTVEQKHQEYLEILIDIWSLVSRSKKQKNRAIVSADSSTNNNPPQQVKTLHRQPQQTNRK